MNSLGASHLDAGGGRGFSRSLVGGPGEGTSLVGVVGAVSRGTSSRDARETVVDAVVSSIDRASVELHDRESGDNIGGRSLSSDLARSRTSSGDWVLLSADEKAMFGVCQDDQMPVLTVNADGDAAANDGRSEDGTANGDERVGLAVRGPVLVALDGTISDGQVVILAVVATVAARVMLGCAATG